MNNNCKSSVTYLYFLRKNLFMKKTRIDPQKLNILEKKPLPIA